MSELMISKKFDNHHTFHKCFKPLFVHIMFFATSFGGFPATPNRQGQRSLSQVAGGYYFVSMTLSVHCYSN